MQFEQSQSIVSRIQQILREYPYGDAVLLELLQNADDATAACAHIHLHNEEKEAPPSTTSTIDTEDDDGAELLLAAQRQHFRTAKQAFGGAALQFYNSSIFTEKDLNNIQNIGGSVHDSKRHDGTKVGRFGLGFNSAYHLSDVIAIVTDRTLIVFDPSRSFLPPDNDSGVRSVGGYRWDFVADCARIERQEKRRPLEVFFLHLVKLIEARSAEVCAGAASAVQGRAATHSAPQFTRAVAYPGTLFYLPLRQRPSDMWREVHSAHDVQKLIQGFYEAATLGLVLTKHVTTVSASLSTAAPKSSRSSSRPLFSLVSNGDSTAAVQTKRAHREWLESYTRCMKMVADLSDDSNWGPHNPRALDKVLSELPQPESFFVNISISMTTFQPDSDDAHTSSSSVKTTEFSVSHFFGPGGGWKGSSAWAIAEESARYHHPIAVPWSAAIVENGQSLIPLASLSAVPSDDAATVATGGGGKLLCFFPIRRATGLPIHIHGYFQLSSDRQSVTAVDKSRWNAAMCKEVVPFAYVCSVLRACQSDEGVPARSPLSLWPLGQFTDVTISEIAKNAIDLLAMQRTIPVLAPPTSTNIVGSTSTRASKVEQLKNALQWACDATQGGDYQRADAPTMRDWKVTYESISHVRFFTVEHADLDDSRRLQPNSGGAVHPSPPMTVATYTCLMYMYRNTLTGNDNSSKRPQQHRSVAPMVFVAYPEEELALVARVASSLRLWHHSVQLIDAAYIRHALVDGWIATREPGAAVHDARGLIPNAAAVPLLHMSLLDDNVASLLSCAGQLPPIVPLQDGFGGLLESKLLTATDPLWYDLAQQLPQLSARLVEQLRTESSIFSAPTSSSASVADRTVMTRAIDSCRKHLQRLQDAKGITTITPAVFAVELKKLLLLNGSGTSSMAQYVWVDEDDGGAGGGAGWWSLQFGQQQATGKNVVRLLMDLLNRHYDAELFYDLPVLPAIVSNQQTSTGASAVSAKTRRVAVSAAAANGAPLVALDDSSAASSGAQEGLRAVRDVLCGLGAIEIDTRIAPVVLLEKWNDGDAHSGRRVAVLAESNPRSARDALYALHCLIQQAAAESPLRDPARRAVLLESVLSKPTAVLPSSAGASVSRAEALLTFFAERRGSLTVADATALAALPLFKTIWGTVSALHRPTAATEGTQMVYRLPTQALPKVVTDALRRQPFASQCSAPSSILASLLIIEEGRTPADVAFLDETLRVPVLPESVAYILAATRMRPPSRASVPGLSRATSDDNAVDVLQKATDDAWHHLFEVLHIHHKSSADTSPLFRASVDLLRETPFLPPLIDDDENGSGDSAAIARIAPSETISADSPELSMLLTVLAVSSPSFSSGGSSVFHQQSLPTQRCLIPRVAAFDVIPLHLRTHVLEVLRVPKSVDGDALVALAQVVSQDLAVATTQQRKQRAGGAAASLSSRPSGSTFLGNDNSDTTQVIIEDETQAAHASCRSITRATAPEMAVYSLALLECLDISRSLTTDQWDIISHLPIVACSAPVTDERNDKDSSPPPVGNVGTDDRDGISMCAPSRVCLPHVYRLCPIGSRRCIHHLMQTLADGKASGSNVRRHDNNTNSISAADAANRFASGGVAVAFPSLTMRYAWGKPPPLKDVLSYVEWRSAKAEGTGTAGSDAVLCDSDTIGAWSGVLEYLEQQCRAYVQRHQTSAAAQRLLPGAALPAATAVVDPLALQADFPDWLSQHVPRMYFPELQHRCFRLHQLSFDENADRCFPFLATINKSSAAQYPTLWALLGVPRAHTASQLVDAMTEMLQEAARRSCSSEAQPPRSRVDPHPSQTRHTTSVGALPPPMPRGAAPTSSQCLLDEFIGVPLDDTLRVPFVAALEYLLSAHPEFVKAKPTDTAASQAQQQGLLVPTSDGSVNWSSKVFYSVVGTASSDASPPGPTAAGTNVEEPCNLLHHTVSSHIAKALGIRHTGLRFLGQMNSKYGRTAFRARGQRQSVVNSIKRILGDYSDPQAVLMEMIQNADDAAANDVVFYLDHRRFSSRNVEGLLGKEMARCQGPALVVYNDKMFTPSDFDALLEIGCGHKAKDQLSIGRFGVGFNAVYHLTDCPSIVSGDTTLFLDPTASHVDSASPDAPGVMIQHTQEPALASYFPDQFAPYLSYGVDFRKSFVGSLFRLPLRVEPWEQSIAQSTWTPVDVLRIFKQFEALMPHVLLFLKHVRRIQLVEVGSDGKKTVVSSTEVPQEHHQRVFAYREALLSHAAVQHPLKPIGDPLHAHCVIPISVRDDGGHRNHTYQWLVSTVIRSIASGPELPNCTADVRRKLIPWGSVAILLTPRAPSSSAVPLRAGQCGSTSRGLEEHLAFARAAGSMVHCFLPLPCNKGELPFHVHGCFALTSDRRGMWTQTLHDDADDEAPNSGDAAHNSSWEVKWNRFILSDVVADAAVKAFAFHPLLRAGEEGPFYRCFPTLFRAPPPGGMSEYQVAAAPPVAISDTLRSVSLGFFRAVYTQDAQILWSTKRAFVEPRYACCSVTQVSAGSSADSAQVPISQMAAHRLPFRLTNAVAELVLDMESLCFVPIGVYHGLVTASVELCQEPPAELNPQKVAKVLHQRAGTSSMYCVAFDALFPSFQAVKAEAKLLQRSAATSAAKPSGGLTSLFSGFVGGGSSSSATSRHGDPYASSDAFAANLTEVDVLVEVTLYLTQCHAAALTEGVPLVLLRDGTVGIVYHSSKNNTPASLYVSPAYRKDVEKLFPDVPVVDEAYFDAVNHQSKKAPHASSSDHSSFATGMFGGGSNTQQMFVFSPEKWAALLCVENLQLQTISRLFHQHASRVVNMSLTLGEALHVDPATQFHRGSPLRRWVQAFWHFVKKAEGVALLDAQTLGLCGDLDKWPLIPATRTDAYVLLPIADQAQLVCGSTQALVYDALEHLGVWALDTEFEEWEIVRNKCSVVDIEGQRIGDLLTHAMTQGRFASMSDAQRQRMLQWLLKCNAGKKSFMSNLFGGSGPMVQSIRKLPLFKRYDGAQRTWVYAPLPASGAAAPPAAPGGQQATHAQSGYALPEGVPLTLLCDGLYEEPISELGLHRMPMEQFLSTKVFDVMQHLQRTAPLDLTISEELAHWRLLAKHMDNTLKAQFEKISFVPREMSCEDVLRVRKENYIQASVAAALSAPRAGEARSAAATEQRRFSLRRAAADWLADSSYDCGELQRHEPLLYSLILAARWDRLDRTRRFVASAVIRPMNCDAAPVPDVLSRLMSANTECFSKIFCSPVLWGDGVIQTLLIKLGAKYSLDTDVMHEASDALRAICTPDRHLLDDFFASNGFARSDASGARQRYEWLQKVSWSVGVCCLRMMETSKSALEAVAAKLLIAPAANPFSSCSNGASAALPSTQPDVPPLYYAADLSAYRYRYAVGLHRQLLPPSLDRLNSQKPPLSDVLAQLCSLLADPALAPMPVWKLDLSLSSVYSCLSTEYRSEVATDAAAHEALITRALFAVPVARSQPFTVMELFQQLGTHCPDEERTLTSDADDDALWSSSSSSDVGCRVFRFVDTPSAPSQSANINSAGEGESWVGASRHHQPGVAEIDALLQCTSLARVAVTSNTPLHPASGNVVLPTPTLRMAPGDSPVVRLISIDQVISIGLHRIGSLRPHFYHMHELEACPPLASLLHAVAASKVVFGTPKPEAVVAALRRYDLCTDIKGEAFDTYVELLKLLQLSCERHGVLMTRSSVAKQQSPSVPNKSKATLGSAAPHVDVSWIRLPTASGRLLHVEADGLAVGDQPSLLRRIQVGSVPLVAPQLPFSVCRFFGVPSIAHVIIETPKTVVVGRGSQNQRVTTDAAGTWCQLRALGVIAAFMRSPLFLRVLHRLLASAAAVSAASTGNSSDGLMMNVNSNISAAVLSLLSSDAVKLFRRIRVVAVEHIEVVIAHRLHPQLNIGKETESPMTAIDTTSGCIYVVTSSLMPSTSAAVSTKAVMPAAAYSAVDAHYLLAMAVQKYLKQPLLPLAPLCCLFEIVGRCQHRGRKTSLSIADVAHDIMDAFDCVDVGPLVVRDAPGAGTAESDEAPERRTAVSTSSIALYRRLCDYEQRAGILLPLRLDVAAPLFANGEVAADIWMLKYGVNRVMPPNLVDSGSCRVATAAARDDVVAAQVPPFPFVLRDEHNEGLHRVRDSGAVLPASALGQPTKSDILDVVEFCFN